jgi:hypothetical protein
VSFLVVGLSGVEIPLVVAAIGEDADSLPVGQSSGPWATVVCLVVHDQVGLVLAGTAAATEGVTTICVEGGVRSFERVSKTSLRRAGNSATGLA